MPGRSGTQLVIDARPRGPHGLLASEHVLGRSVLAHTVDLALSVASAPVAIHARLEEHGRLEELVGADRTDRVVFATGPPPEDSAILRTDRLYDGTRLRRALRNSRDPESAVLWRLDGPQGLEGAEDELVRRRSYQPLGRYWALAPARGLARLLQPTRIRPNMLTMAAASLMIGASAATAFAETRAPVCLAIAAALALALVLDTADGHLARLQGTASEFGRWLDTYLDELADMALHAGVAWSAFARTGQPGWLVLGMLYGMGKYVFVAGNAAAASLPPPFVGEGWGGGPKHRRRSQSGPPPRPNPPPHGGEGTRGAAPSTSPPPQWGAGTRGTAPSTTTPPQGAERTGGAASSRLTKLVREQALAHARELVRWMGHADVRWHLWIVLAAVGRLDWALAAYACYFPARSLAGAIRKGVGNA